MATTPHVIEGSAELFPRLVLENSERGPVLVYYWSPRAGPCMMLMPRLLKLAGEIGGRFLLVLLNTDEFGQLSRSQGVVSIPTVKVYRHGKAVDTLHGAESEDTVRAFIRKHLDDPSTTLLQKALATHASGDTAGAARLAAEAALANPQDTRIPLQLAKMLVLQKRYAQADDLLQALPPEARDDPELHRFAAHVSILRTAQEAPPKDQLVNTIATNPDDLEARYQLSAVHLVADELEPAMEQLLEIARRDRAFRNDAGRAGLQALFELLGDNDERVVRYRELLQASLH